MRHAWLIIAHNEFTVLQRLVSMLDDARSDFYIHFDRKVRQVPEIEVQKGRLFVLSERVDVRWGTVSQIRTELKLLSAATEGAGYDYYHVISGTTLPLKSMNEIDSYFSRMKGKSVMTGLCKDNPYQETLKIHRFNFFIKHYASRNALLSKSSQFLWKSSVAVQRMLGIRINKKGEYYKASNWLSLTDEATKYLLSREKMILRNYRYSFCGDEYFVPSELMSSPLFRGRLIEEEAYLKHEIGRSNAATLRQEDIPDLQQSGYLFARKFSL